MHDSSSKDASHIPPFIDIKFLLRARPHIQSKVSVNWCSALGTVLANEEVIDGLSERGDHPVERLPLRQWVLEITKYADSLEKGLESLDWPAGTMTSQKRWIGKSTGCEISFMTEGKDSVPISVFTTRCDTLMGVTYVSLAPEHPLVQSLTSPEQKSAVESYVAETSSRSDLDRTSSKEKTGVFTGSNCVHPLTGDLVPIWVADYVLGSYGSGAVMAVPAHDERDFEFATKFNLPINAVVADPEDPSEIPDLPYTADGVSINCGAELDGLTTAQCKKTVTNLLEG